MKKRKKMAVREGRRETRKTMKGLLVDVQRKQKGPGLEKCMRASVVAPTRCTKTVILRGVDRSVYADREEQPPCNH